uniref:Uncharacterized protein n=1 Tax=Oryza punctata TaxID=4537 RepID=A0A0E0M5Q4_ORYPU
MASLGGTMPTDSSASSISYNIVLDSTIGTVVDAVHTVFHIPEAMQIDLGTATIVADSTASHASTAMCTTLAPFLDKLASLSSVKDACGVLDGLFIVALWVFIALLRRRKKDERTFQKELRPYIGKGAGARKKKRQAGWRSFKCVAVVLVNLARKTEAYGVKAPMKTKGRSGGTVLKSGRASC